MKYFTNTSWLLGEKILRMAVGLFVGIWVARYLGPEQFGLFSYAQSFVALFAAIATFGLDGIVIRELVKDESQRDRLLGTAFILKLAGSILVLSLLAISILFQSNDLQTNTLIFIIASATVLQSFNVIDFYFQSQVLSKFIVFSNLFSLLLSSIIKVVLILNEAPLEFFAYVILFDSFILASGFIYFYLKKKFFLLKWRFSTETAISLLTESWPLVLSSVVVSIYMKVDQVMIQNILGNDSVGQYAAAVRLSEAWYFIPVVIASSLFPAIINAKEKSRSLYINRFQRLNDILVWGAIFIAIPVTFLGDWVINTLYGEQYNQAGSVLVIHIWASVFVFMTVSSGKFLVTENMVKKIFYRNLCGLSVNLSLNAIFIPLYGIKAAAVATLISWIVAGYLYDFLDKDINYMFRIKSKSFNVFRLCSFLIKIWKK